MKIDVKDRKILYELDVNARQSCSQIGKKVGLSKNSVHHRIKRLEEKKIIENYYTVINSFKLGYHVIRFYIRFQYTTEQIERDIIEHLRKSKFTWVVYSVNGWFDLDVIFWIKRFDEFYIFWKNTLELYGDYFKNQKLSHLIRAESFRMDYLLDRIQRTSKSTNTIVTGYGSLVDIDELDMKILRMIAPNARMEITAIAKELQSTTKTIYSRLKNLTKIGVIQGYRVNIDITKLNYYYFGVDITLREGGRRVQIIDYVKTMPFLTCIDTSLGHSHVELEFHLKDVDQLKKIMYAITEKYPKSVREYQYETIGKVHKMVWIPEI